MSKSREFAVGQESQPHAGHFNYERHFLTLRLIRKPVAAITATEIRIGKACDGFTR